MGDPVGGPPVLHLYLSLNHEGRSGITDKITGYDVPFVPHNESCVFFCSSMLTFKHTRALSFQAQRSKNKQKRIG